MLSKQPIFTATNLIAGGEHPLLIDLEALFHPRVANALDRGRADDFGWRCLGPIGASHRIAARAIVGQ